MACGDIKHTKHQKHAKTQTRDSHFILLILYLFLWRWWWWWWCGFFLFGAPPFDFICVDRFYISFMIVIVYAIVCIPLLCLCFIFFASFYSFYMPFAPFILSISARLKFIHGTVSTVRALSMPTKNAEILYFIFLNNYYFYSIVVAHVLLGFCFLW